MKIAVLILGFFLIAAGPSAPTQKLPPIPPYNPRVMERVSVFAINAKTCPVGSEPYRGPAAKLVSGGIIYCQFPQDIFVFEKKFMPTGKCPPGLRDYRESTVRPDPDIMWCERDLPPNMMAPKKHSETPPPKPPLTLPTPKTQ